MESHLSIHLGALCLPTLLKLLQMHQGTASSSQVLHSLPIMEGANVDIVFAESKKHPHIIIKDYECQLCTIFVELGKNKIVEDMSLASKEFTVR